MYQGIQKYLKEMTFQHIFDTHLSRYFNIRRKKADFYKQKPAHDIVVKIVFSFYNNSS